MRSMYKIHSDVMLLPGAYSKIQCRGDALCDPGLTFYKLCEFSHVLKHFLFEAQQICEQIGA